MAQGWDAGILPYRDVALYNFPGQVELFWLLGKSFGWGRTELIYAVDAAMLLAFGLLISLWSHREFGRISPGLVGFLAFLHYYLGLDYKLVAQRDWQGPVLVILGMLLIETLPGLAGPILSGLLFGLAFVFRPHVLLFTPAVMLAVATKAAPGQGSEHPGGRPWGCIRALLLFTLAASLGAAAGFAPLAAQGLLGDCVRGVREATRGRYGQYPENLLGKVIGQLAEPRLAIGTALAWATVYVAPSRVRRVAVPWVLCLTLVLLYRPLHPVPHAYLLHPLWLVWSVNLALVTGTVLTLLKGRPRLALASVALLVALASPGTPQFCDPGASVLALRDIGLGTVPSRVPPGAAMHFAPAAPHSPYTWDQYRRVLVYLRSKTGPQTLVANLLRNVPFPSLNGTIGRISPLPADAGIVWLYMLDTSREVNFALALEAAQDAVVVWIPGERSFDPRLQLPILESTVPKFYRPEATIAGIQIWRRIPRARPAGT
jgi:hypothetical protein